MKAIKLDENKNPYLPTRKMKITLLKSIKEVSDYPEMLPESLEQTSGNVFEINPENIVFGNGSMEIFGNLVEFFGNTSYGLLTPTFWGFKHFLYLLNFRNILEFELSDKYSINLNNLKLMASKVSVIYLCNPNNPTLTYFNKSDLIKIIRNNPNCYFIIDETILTYENFKSLTLSHHVNELSNLIVVISLSKILGVAGLRCGLLFANNNVCKYLKSKHIPFSTNTITQSFFKNNIYLFNNLTKIKSKIYTNYKFLINNLPKDFHINIMNRNSCFILIYTSEIIDLHLLKEFLEKKNIYIRYSFELKNSKDNFIRVSAGKRSQYRKLIKYIELFMKKELQYVK